LTLDAAIRLTSGAAEPGDSAHVNDLQARSAYQPIIHEQGGRFIAYIGHHGGEALNPLTGVVEKNGTSIVDVTNPSRPVFLKHIPGPSGVGEAGGAQMVRACSEAELTHNATRTRQFLLRATASSHEVFDVTNPASPTLVSTPVANLRNTHKSWWECDTGIAYLVSDGTSLVVPELEDQSHDADLRSEQSSRAEVHPQLRPPRSAARNEDDAGADRSARHDRAGQPRLLRTRHGVERDHADRGPIEAARSGKTA
jgi:hypothetical protein